MEFQIMKEHLSYLASCISNSELNSNIVLIFTPLFLVTELWYYQGPLILDYLYITSVSLRE